MKRIIAGTLVALCLATSAANEDNKDSYYLALSTMSNTEATQSFLLEQFLQQKCGKEQSIGSLKTSTPQLLYVLIALKDGNVEKAESILNGINCEK